MARSIRTLLLSWYAVILAVTLGVFGGVLFALCRRAVLGGVEDRLLARAQAIAAAAEVDDDDAEGEDGGGGEGDEDGDGRGEREDEGRLEIDLAGSYLASFRAGLPGEPYFVIWNPRGEVALSSLGETGGEGSPQRPFLRAGRDPAPEPPFEPPDRTGLRDHGTWREAVVAGRDGFHVAVGESLAAPRAELLRFLWLLIGSGAGVLGLSLAGGWLLSGRVLSPIHRMSRAASEISARNLSRRIDTGRTARELGLLAATLNDAFDRLQEAVERQSRFTADASHELRTPVTVVLVAAEQALSRARDESESREELESILRAAKRMRELVEGLLTLSRADSGTLGLRRDDIDLHALILETLALLRPLALDRGVDLSGEALPETIPGDRERLREVLVELVTNAVRYNRRGGGVVVSCGEAPRDGSSENGRREVRIEVRDTGPGIPPEHLPRLFERFYRVDAARSRREGGCGLGLSICRNIVEAHGGTIEVESRPGEGSVFTVRLPARREA